MSNEEYMARSAVLDLHSHVTAVLTNIRLLKASFVEEYATIRAKVARNYLTEHFLHELPDPSDALQSITSFAQRLNDLVNTARKEIE